MSIAIIGGSGLSKLPEVKINDEIVVAKDLQQTVIIGCGISEVETLKLFKGSDLEGTECAHPFNGHGYDFSVKVFKADS